MRFFKIFVELKFIYYANLNIIIILRLIIIITMTITINIIIKIINILNISYFF